MQPSIHDAATSGNATCDDRIAAAARYTAAAAGRCFPAGPARRCPPPFMDSRTQAPTPTTSSAGGQRAGRQRCHSYRLAWPGRAGRGRSRGRHGLGCLQPAQSALACWPALRCLCGLVQAGYMSTSPAVTSATRHTSAAPNLGLPGHGRLCRLAPPLRGCRQQGAGQLLRAAQPARRYRDHVPARRSPAGC